jgi:hypothetical protein
MAQAVKNLNAYLALHALLPKSVFDFVPSAGFACSSTANLHSN